MPIQFTVSVRTNPITGQLEHKIDYEKNAIANESETDLCLTLANAVKTAAGSPAKIIAVARDLKDQKLFVLNKGTDHEGCETMGVYTSMDEGVSASKEFLKAHEHFKPDYFEIVTVQLNAPAATSVTGRADEDYRIL